MTTFKVGDRVRVIRDPKFPSGPFKGEPTGTVGQWPNLPGICEAQGRTFREVQGRKRVIRSYWVIFDRPAFDGDGDGPYEEAEIDEEHLERA